MKIKFGFALAIICCSGIAYADRFYLGGESGLVTSLVDYTPEAVPGTFVTQVRLNNSHMLTGAGFLGYTHCFGNNFCGEAEISVAFYPSNSTITTVQSTNAGVTRNGSFDFELKNSYGFHLKPAYYFTDNFLVYGDLGYISGQYRNASSFNYNNGTPSFTSNFHRTVYGFTYGIGSEYNVTERIGIRFEYLHTRFNRYVDRTFPDSSYSSLYKPTINQYLLGLVYTFGDRFISQDL